LCFQDYGKSFYFGFGHKPFEAACCKEKRCFMTDKRSIIPIEDFDAVLMHLRPLKKKYLPKKRKRHQRWVMYEREPPPYSSNKPRDFDGVFNWTMTYRRDSDIINGYGAVYKKKDFTIEDFSNVERLSDSLDSVMKTKNKMVAWFVSNCKVGSKRLEYVKELQMFIPVDIYGKCGPLKCGTRRREESCNKKIEKEYKFYLSFENNFCKDYVTEKFYKILSYYIIPIVRGSGDYAAIAPPHSYINVEDFRIPRDLANYLYYLHRNETAYMEYFK
ncbi:Alpha-(1,3)-fucosyltransferase C, partial [Armadillidium nasatum]